MKKILYLSIVDWDWIKQRPQMIAEELSKDNDVFCIYPVYYKKSELAKNEVESTHLYLLPRIKIPFTAKICAIKKIDSFWQHIVVAKAIKKYSPDIIFTSYPMDYSIWLKKYSGIVVYDCMDNYSEFVGSNIEKKRLRDLENKLINISSKVFVSSKYLENTLIKNYGVTNNKISLVRNGYDGKIINTELLQRDNDHITRIAYIGTVSSWFDFDIILQALDKCSDLEIHIFGPVNVEKPMVKNLFFRGVIEHDDLYDTIKNFDGLIMPFIVNEIIEAVDPVKLYEYINYNKPIISVYYKELNYFSDFVWFYEDLKTLVYAINNVRDGKRKYDNEQRVEFLKRNSWKERIKVIGQALDGK